LQQKASEGAFLSSLLYRLNGVVLRLPPLRERREDVPMLFDHFLRDAAARLKRETPRITASHWAMLAGHDWPGNVRELTHYAERTVLNLGQADTSSDAQPLTLAERVAKFEAEEIRRILSEQQGRVSKAIVAARMPRKTFYDKLRRYGIDPKTWRSR
jgi:two-component system C4-dicarboxylate transport response regulator DctD